MYEKIKVIELSLGGHQFSNTSSQVEQWSFRTNLCNLFDKKLKDLINLVPTARCLSWRFNKMILYPRCLNTKILTFSPPHFLKMTIFRKQIRILHVARLIWHVWPPSNIINLTKLMTHLNYVETRETPFETRDTQRWVLGGKAAGFLGIEIEAGTRCLKRRLLSRFNPRKRKMAVCVHFEFT